MGSQELIWKRHADQIIRVGQFYGGTFDEIDCHSEVNRNFVEDHLAPTEVSSKEEIRRDIIGDREDPVVRNFVEDHLAPTEVSSKEEIRRDIIGDREDPVVMNDGALGATNLIPENKEQLNSPKRVEPGSSKITFNVTERPRRIIKPPNRLNL
ncbi:hypothetical protein QE152_g1359 [Popillia japonica]|uniref:Uncharacterized protein n=1 Tax=Popillia japonica TaxID=7064 RepID=A0AAW1NB02_POPJA